MDLSPDILVHIPCQCAFSVLLPLLLSFWLIHSYSITLYLPFVLPLHFWSPFSPGTFSDIVVPVVLVWDIHGRMVNLCIAIFSLRISSAETFVLSTTCLSEKEYLDSHEKIYEPLSFCLCVKSMLGSVEWSSCDCLVVWIWHWEDFLELLYLDPLYISPTSLTALHLILVEKLGKTHNTLSYSED